MSYPDPLPFTIAGTAVSLPRVSVGGRSAIYADKAGTFTTNISHTNGKRSRSVVQLQQAKIAPDAINPTINKPLTQRVYVVLDTPLVGFTDLESEDLIKALAAFITNATNLSKFTGQES